MINLSIMIFSVGLYVIVIVNILLIYIMLN